jgi:hypothetical protein
MRDNIFFGLFFKKRRCLISHFIKNIIAIIFFFIFPLSKTFAWGIKMELSAPKYSNISNSSIIYGIGPVYSVTNNIDVALVYSFDNLKQKDKKYIYNNKKSETSITKQIKPYEYKNNRYFSLGYPYNAKLPIDPKTRQNYAVNPNGIMSWTESEICRDTDKYYLDNHQNNARSIAEYYIYQQVK